MRERCSGPVPPACATGAHQRRLPGDPGAQLPGAGGAGCRWAARSLVCFLCIWGDPELPRRDEQVAAACWAVRDPLLRCAARCACAAPHDACNTATPLLLRPPRRRGLHLQPAGALLPRRHHRCRPAGAGAALPAPEVRPGLRCAAAGGHGGRAAGRKAAGTAGGRVQAAYKVGASWHALCSCMLWCFLSTGGWACSAARASATRG